ncbi:hypothetical protein GCM10010277_84760 [Streptomyces longisporoflavus]|uniref:hypothetical protein n=1 Tax=Streptomyces longisporoflavus TaxID=28044 RepID=UPI00167E92F9|nr:hypothetical protein [Streptomyces longisporoflavus]GGV72168.1 hypothetical protein GCM10010277_84760 [Streptomyces longisporoflavus]
MTYVRPHRRRDGTYVKGHHRRTRPRAAQPYAMPPRTAGRRAPAPRTRPVVSTGATAYVAPYSRADGTRVRGHHRTVAPRTAAVATGTGGGFLLLVLVLLALAGGPGEGSKDPADTKSPQSTPAPSDRHR